MKHDFYRYNFEINTLSINSDSDINKVIVIKKDSINEENDISNFFDNNNRKSEQERIGELYSKQILRVLRMLYFIVIKQQEKTYRAALSSNTDNSEETKLKLFHVLMQLTSFDDMNNYNNLMKSALELLTSMIKESSDPSSSIFYQAMEIMRNYYRSDLMHRRSKRTVSNLKIAIQDSALPSDISSNLLDIIEKN